MYQTVACYWNTTAYHQYKRENLQHQAYNYTPGSAKRKSANEHHSIRNAPQWSHTNRGYCHRFPAISRRDQTFQSCFLVGFGQLIYFTDVFIVINKLYDWAGDLKLVYVGQTKVCIYFSFICWIYSRPHWRNKRWGLNASHA